MKIDVNFNFTTDTSGFWDGFWDSGLGNHCDNCDPDAISKTLKEYHRILWSRKLPNGQVMKLADNGDYLGWGDFRFASDILITGQRYERIRKVLEDVPNYRQFVEEFVRKAYTIGNFIIWPKHNNSINQVRGTCPGICDRFDLTLDCIKKYYNGETSELYDVLVGDKKFFDLFVDFNGFVDFFYLGAWVDKEYKVINLSPGNDVLPDNSPKNSTAYIKYVENALGVIEQRNNDIKGALLK